MPLLPLSPLPGSRRWLRRVLLLCAAATLAACAGNAAPAGPFPRFAEFEGDEVTAVRFQGLGDEVPRDSVRAVVSTRPTRCASPVGFCPFGWGRRRGELDLGVLSRDVIRIQLVYRDAGYYGTRVTPRVEPSGDDQVRVTFTVDPGDLVTLRELEVEGASAILDTARLRRRLPLREGEPFRRNDFAASADTVRAQLLRGGYVYAQVFRNYSIDTIADVAEVRFEAAPGPLVRVDSVLVAGTYRLSEETVRRQLTFDEGDVLRLSDLNQSQLNLFELELVDFASVEIAPDSLQLSPDTLALEPDSIGSTVLVRVVEAARYQMETALGYGTQDCLRGEVTRVDRDFLGGARRLELSASVAKVGAGDPLNLEERTVCRELDPARLDRRPTREDSLTALSLNYRVAANFLQPRFFGTRTSVVAAAQAERVTEVGLYLRESLSGQLGMVRRVAPRTVLTATLNAERGRTEASPFYLCLALDVCEPEELDFVTEPRWNNFLNVSVVHNRTRGGVQPTGGYTVRGGVDLASALIGSDDRYGRAVAEGALYRQVRPGWTLSGRVLAGSFLPGLGDDDGYIPPEQRFYAGGPNTVRGFYRNQLGPQVYVAPADTSANGYDDGEIRNSATGGTRTVVASVELQTPSPVLRDRLRLAAFVDAGQVWDSRGCGDRERDGVPVAGTRCNLGLRFTPGAGVRVGTPVGPIRLDVAFNPYGREPGPLYVYDPNTGVLDPTPQRFRDTGRSFFEYLTIHIAVGNAF